MLYWIFLFCLEAGRFRSLCRKLSTAMMAELSHWLCRSSTALICQMWILGYNLEDKGLSSASGSWGPSHLPATSRTYLRTRLTKNREKIVITCSRGSTFHPLTHKWMNILNFHKWALKHIIGLCWIILLVIFNILCSEQYKYDFFAYEKGLFFKNNHL